MDRLVLPCAVLALFAQTASAAPRPAKVATAPAMVTHTGTARTTAPVGSANGVNGTGLARAASRGMAGGGGTVPGGISGASVHRPHQ